MIYKHATLSCEAATIPTNESKSGAHLIYHSRGPRFDMNLSTPHFARQQLLSRASFDPGTVSRRQSAKSCHPLFMRRPCLENRGEKSRGWQTAVGKWHNKGLGVGDPRFQPHSNQLLVLETLVVRCL